MFSIFSGNVRYCYEKGEFKMEGKLKLKEVGRVGLDRLLQESFVPGCGEFEQSEGVKGGLLARVGKFGIDDFYCVGYESDGRELAFYGLAEEGESLEGISIVDWKLMGLNELEYCRQVHSGQIAIPPKQAKSVCIYGEEEHSVKISFIGDSYPQEVISYDNSGSSVRTLCLGLLVL